MNEREHTQLEDPDDEEIASGVSIRVERLLTTDPEFRGSHRPSLKKPENVLVLKKSNDLVAGELDTYRQMYREGLIAAGYSYYVDHPVE